MNPIENVLSGITGQKIPFPEPIGNKAYMELKLSWENEKPGALDKIDGVTCEKCLNRGYTAVLDDDCGISHKECECMVQRRSVMRMKKSGLWELLKTKTFDSYTTASKWQDVAKKRCMHYAETTDNGWLYMGGQSGFGKTHLCTAVCARLMERGYNVSYFLWHDLLQRFEAARFSEERYSEIVRMLRDPDVVYIDDFLKTPGGDDERNSKPESRTLQIAFDVVNIRSNSGKKTILSSEFQIADIAAFDRATAGRIAENTTHKVFVNLDNEKNYRLKKSRNKE